MLKNILLSGLVATSMLFSPSSLAQISISDQDVDHTNINPRYVKPKVIPQDNWTIVLVYGLGGGPKYIQYYGTFSSYESCESARLSLSLSGGKTYSLESSCETM